MCCSDMINVLQQMKKNFTPVRFFVIAGYLLLVMMLVAGLIAIYQRLVVYSNKKTGSENTSELLIVGNTLSKLYEIESEQNLLTAESSRQSYRKYQELMPRIFENLDSLKLLTTDSVRMTQIDTVRFLLEEKENMLGRIVVLLDSIRKIPTVTVFSDSSYAAKDLNRQILAYLQQKMLTPSKEVRVDTTVLKGKQKSFWNRVRDVFVPTTGDSTIVIQNKEVVEGNKLKLVVDTVIHRIRTSERLNLEKQKQIYRTLVRRQEEMNQANRKITLRIDALLREIEAEEVQKSLRQVQAKEEALFDSKRIVFGVSCAAAWIAWIFGLLFVINFNKGQRYKRQLEASNQHILKLMNSREKLMLSISHDIKAPVSSILGYLELMEGDVSREKSDRYLSNMKQSGAHLLQLVSSLLDYHQLDSGRWKMQESTFNLFDLINDTALSFEPLAIQKNVDFRIINRLHSDRTVSSDPYVLRQIIGNLISNAVKYTDSGSITVVADEEVRGIAYDLRFSVKDTGTGIDRSEQSSIFDKYHRLRRELQEQPMIEGSGLGLTITKGFVEALQGSIRVDSEKGKGSEFTVSIPMKMVSKSGLNHETDEKEKDRPPEDISVLVVDDDPVQLMMVSEMLHRLQMECVLESQPEELFSLVRKRSFDILFMDLRMPQMSGKVLIQRLRAMEPTKNLPIIALSARSDIYRSDIRKAGFTDFLPKLFTLKQLDGMIRRYAVRVNRDGAARTPPEMAASNGMTPDAEERAPTGVASLIAYVREDREVSAEILETFIAETSEQITLWRQGWKQQDLLALERLSHKMLPLFRMMGDEKLIVLMEKAERKQPLSEVEKEALLKGVRRAVEDARKLHEDISH